MSKRAAVLLESHCAVFEAFLALIAPFALHRLQISSNMTDVMIQMEFLSCLKCCDQY